MTSDGRFATELEIDGELSGTLAEKNQVHRIICRFITLQGVWEKGNPNDLKFRSKRQLNALKSLGTGPLSGDDKKLLGLTTPPRAPVLLACAKGCARLISSDRAATPEGKKEAEIIIDAASNADPQLGKQMAKAAEEGNPFRFKKETLADLQRHLDSLPGRLNKAISLLESPNKTTLSTVERVFKSDPDGPFPDLENPSKVAKSLRRVLEDVTFKMRFITLERFIHYPTERPVDKVEQEFKSDPRTTAVAFGGDIYVHEIRYSPLSPIQREALVLHEIVHLTLRTTRDEDIRYIHEGIEGIPAHDALNNADSIVGFVFVDDLVLLGG